MIPIRCHTHRECSGYWRNRFPADFPSRPGPPGRSPTNNNRRTSTSSIAAEEFWNLEDDPHLVVRRQAPVGQSPRDLLPRCVPGLIDLDILFAMLFGGRSRTGRRGSSQLRSDQERGRYDHRILGAPVRIALVIQPRTPQRIFTRRSRDPDMVHAEIIVVIDIVERPAIGVGRIIPHHPEPFCSQA